MLDKLLHLVMCWHRMGVLELRGRRGLWRFRRHVLDSLGVIERRIGHIGIARLRWWSLRGVWLRRCEVRTRTADVGARIGAREMTRLW
jgi:hypothetical protein